MRAPEGGQAAGDSKQLAADSSWLAAGQRRAVVAHRLAVAAQMIAVAARNDAVVGRSHVVVGRSLDGKRPVAEAGSRPPAVLAAGGSRQAVVAHRMADVAHMPAVAAHRPAAAAHRLAAKLRHRLAAVHGRLDAVAAVHDRIAGAAVQDRLATASHGVRQPVDLGGKPRTKRDPASKPRILLELESDRREELQSRKAPNPEDLLRRLVRLLWVDHLEASNEVQVQHPLSIPSGDCCRAHSCSCPNAWRSHSKRAD